MAYTRIIKCVLISTLALDWLGCWNVARGPICVSWIFHSAWYHVFWQDLPNRQWGAHLLVAIVMHYSNLLLANILLNGGIHHPISHCKFNAMQLKKVRYELCCSEKVIFHKIRNFDVIRVTHIILFIMYVAVRVTASLILCTWNISLTICTRFCCTLCFHGVIIICKFVNYHNEFTQLDQGCFIGTGAMVKLHQC